MSDASDTFHPALLNLLFFFFPSEHLGQWCAAEDLTPLAADGGQRQGPGFSSASAAGIPTVADFRLPPT